LHPLHFFQSLSAGRLESCAPAFAGCRFGSTASTQRMARVFPLIFGWNTVLPIARGNAMRLSDIGGMHGNAVQDHRAVLAASRDRRRIAGASGRLSEQTHQD